MTPETFHRAQVLSEKVEAHEDFISNCDYFVRNLQPTSIPVVDRWLEAAIRDGVLESEELKLLFTDLRDVVTTRLADLDRELQSL